MNSFTAFKAFGIEMEYMVVDPITLNILPIADRILAKAAGYPTEEVEGEGVNWSNELVKHVVELKNPVPVSSFTLLREPFYLELQRLWKTAEELGAQLLPTAMHPWMDPLKETHLWPLENRKIYETYDRIFKCQGHGWANLQSTHINVAFGQTDQDFGKVHAVLRLICPLIPIIASSSPYQEGTRGPYKSMRLYHYLQNQKRIPSILGPVIPEQVWTPSDYEEKILKAMYQEIAPFDKENVLQYDWLNSRAVIPKFATHRFEVRVMDLQECPLADLSLSWFFIEIAKLLLQEHWVPLGLVQKLSSQDLKKILVEAAEKADETWIENSDFLNCFGLRNPKVRGSELLNY
ncbi:MAG: hypothetical protein KDD22_08845, partial [Bdellovibrionales bacterium]|nr:hypothetical protein [Bdellovibrionales bacterium]